jgi:hypothetical protein
MYLIARPSSPVGEVIMSAASPTSSTPLTTMGSPKVNSWSSAVKLLLLLVGVAVRLSAAVVRDNESTRPTVLSGKLKLTFCCWG